MQIIIQIEHFYLKQLPQNILHHVSTAYGLYLQDKTCLYLQDKTYLCLEDKTCLCLWDKTCLRETADVSCIIYRENVGAKSTAACWPACSTRVYSSDEFPFPPLFTDTIHFAQEQMSFFQHKQALTSMLWPRDDPRELSSQQTVGTHAHQRALALQDTGPAANYSPDFIRQL